MEILNANMKKSFAHVRVFCTVYNPKQSWKKLDKSVLGRMFGYMNYKEWYQFYEQFLNKIVYPRDVNLAPEFDI
jgi:hypothetical protein